MESVWRWVIWLLTWLAAEPDAIEREAPRSAAAVAYAYATLATGSASPAPPPAPKPTGKCDCGCVNGRWKPDGSITEDCPCASSCSCKASRPR